MVSDIINLKIVYIVVSPYGLRDHHRFGVDYLMEHGYDVEIWRIISNESITMTYSAGMYRGNNYFELKEKEYLEKIKVNKDSIFVLYEVNNLLIPLAAEGLKFILMEGLGAIPWPESEDIEGLILPALGVAKRISLRIKQGFVSNIQIIIERIKNCFISNQIHRVLEKNPPCMIITSTRFSANTYLERGLIKGNVKYIHSLDWDRYIEANRTESKNSIEGRYIVYCDTGYFHRGLDSLASSRDLGEKYASQYFEQINGLFDKLESHYGIPIVIAGHPHIVYRETDFCGREVIFDQTCELTRNAAMFITTTSTAMSFAVMYNKPTLQIANGYMKGMSYNGLDVYKFIRYEAENILGCGFIDMDNKEAMSHPWDYIKEIDSTKRAQYLEKYIIDNSTNDQLIIEFLEKQLYNL